MRPQKEQNAEATAAEVEPQVTKGDNGDTLVSFSRRSHSLQRTSKSFRTASLSRGSGHLAA